MVACQVLVVGKRQEQATWAVVRRVARYAVCAAYQRGRQVLHANAASMARAGKDILHETVAFNPEAERGACRKTNDAEGGGDGGEGECEEMGNMECRCDREVVFEFIPVSFL